MIRNEKNYFNDMWALSVDMFQQLLHNPILDFQQKLHTACGVPSVAKVEKQPVIAEFTSFQDTIMFHKRGRFGLEKVQNSEVHVKVVLDMEYGNI